MSEPLGLSIGTTSMVAARVGSPPVTRRSVLTVSGQPLGGFVERAGDPVPLVAADGSRHLADDLIVAVLDEMASGSAGGQVAIAVPAHWNGATLRALRSAMRSRPNLAPGGVPARLVSDAVTTLTALHASPGLPTSGVVALMDFGGGGTTVTLADAASSFETIETRRIPDFSGDQIDQALMTDVLDRIADAGGVDPAGTAAVGSLALLRDECRRAKERLSEQAATEVVVQLPGHRSTATVTRDDLQALLNDPFAAVLAELDDLLSRNRIQWSDVTAVAMAGGGARIPLIGERLAEHTRSPVITTAQPALDAAVGAAVFAAHAADSDAQTGVAHAAVVTEAISQAAPGTATFRALAWSQDQDTQDPVPYTGPDTYVREDAYGTPTPATGAVAQQVPGRGEYGAYDDEPRAWQRVPQMAIGVAAAVALIAVGGVAIALTSATDETRPTPSTAPVTATSSAPPITSQIPPPPSELPPPPAEPAPAPPVTEAPPPPPETVTVERPVTTTPPTTTTTTTTPSTTTTTTTTTPPTTTTTTTTPPMTTSYITVPFVPVPIPVQVPNTPVPPPVYQQPPLFPY
jgi:hypothetical protein